MDRRLALAFFAAVLLLLWLGRDRLFLFKEKRGGFEYKEGEETAVELPGVVVPYLPPFRRGPAFWQQTTGLICSCEHRSYVSPIVVRQVTIPLPPLPRYVNIPRPTHEIASSIPLTYTTRRMRSDYTVWAGREEADVWEGSDGRIFLQPKRGIWGQEEPNVSTSNLFIGTNEYTFTNGRIFYGPYVYSPQDQSPAYIPGDQNPVEETDEYEYGSNMPSGGFYNSGGG